eukprot:gene43622-58093_t
MAIREILVVPHPVLKQVSKPVAVVDDALRALMDDMLDTMYDAPGIGLAAVQIGELHRVVVMDLGDGPLPEGAEPPAEGEETRVPNPRFFINPEYFDEVERPARVKLTYLNYQGEPVEEDAEGMFAVCIQHEMDHLDGVLFIDHLSRLKREQAIKKVKKLPPAPRGRGHELKPSPVHAFADSHDIAVRTPVSMRDPAEVA